MKTFLTQICLTTKSVYSSYTHTLSVISLSAVLIMLLQQTALASILGTDDTETGLFVGLAKRYLEDRASRITDAVIPSSKHPALTDVPITNGLRERFVHEADELDQRRERFTTMGGGYARHEVSLDVVSVQRSARTVTLLLSENTKLYYTHVTAPDAPRYSDYKVAHTLVFTRNAADSWRLADDLIDLPVDAIGYLTYTDAGRTQKPVRMHHENRLPPVSAAAAMSVGTAATQLPPVSKTLGYDYTAMVAYAKKWANDRNPDYRAFGNDCANFVSQSLAAGGWEKGPKWYHYFSPSENGPIWFWSNTWTVSHDFYFFALEDSKRTTALKYFEEIQLADVLQADWDHADGSPRPDGVLDHTMIVTRVDAASIDDIYLSYHTHDRLDRKLSEILTEVPATPDRANYYGHRT